MTVALLGIGLVITCTVFLLEITPFGLDAVLFDARALRGSSMIRWSSRCEPTLSGFAIPSRRPSTA